MRYEGARAPGNFQNALILNVLGSEIVVAGSCSVLCVCTRWALEGRAESEWWSTTRMAYFIASLPGLPKNAGFSKLNTGSTLMYR
jgi:hypothetical protein